MAKFFIPKQNISDSQVIIDSEDVGHILRVLRLKEGDKLIVCDSSGYDYCVTISEIQSKKILCNIISKEFSQTEPNISVTLFQGIPKSSKMDYIIQKTTELGINRIVPCIMERCVVKLDDEKSQTKKMERWQKIAESAAKQSGRGIIPEVTMPVSFTQALSMMKELDIHFSPYECEEQSTLKPVLLSKNSPKTVGFLIGPEGGFDPIEIEELTNNDITTVTLGKRILRTETAGESVLSMIMYEIGDINKISGGL